MATYKSRYFTAAEIDELLKVLDDYVLKSHLKDAVTIDEEGNIGIETPNRILEKDGSCEVHNKNSQSKAARYFGGGRATLKIWQSQSPDEEDTQYNDKVDVPTKGYPYRGKNGEDANTTAYRSTAGNVLAYIGQMFRGFIYKIQIYFSGGSFLMGDGQGLQYKEGRTQVMLKDDGKHNVSCVSSKVTTEGGTYAYIRNSGIELFSTGTKSDGTVTTSKLNVSNSKATYEGESFTFKGADPKRDSDPTGGSSLVNKKYVDSVKETVDGLIGSVPCNEYIHHTAYGHTGRDPENDFYEEYFDGIVITPLNQGNAIGVTNYDYLIEHTAVGEKTFVVKRIQSENGNDYDYDMYISVHEVNERGYHSITRQEISPELVYYISKGLYESDLAFPGVNHGVINGENGYYKFTTVPNYNYSGSFNGHSYTGRVAGTKFSNTESNPVEVAQNTADEAARTASNANYTANSAQSTANNAYTNANNAYTNANNAYTTANGATAKANLAVKMATNSLVGITPKIVYKKYSSSEYTIETDTIYADDESILRNTDTEEVLYLDCTNLTTLDNFANGYSESGTAKSIKHFGGLDYTTSLRGFGSAFLGCTTIRSIDLSTANMQGVVNLSYSFQGASMLTDFKFPKSWDSLLRLNLTFFGTNIKELIFPRDATNINMINQNSFGSMKSVTIIDLDQVTATLGVLGDAAFANCSSLKTLLITNADFVNITKIVNWQGQPTGSATTLLRGDTSLVNFSGFKNFKLSYSLQDSPLSHESAMNCINGLYDLTEGGTVTDYTPQTLTFKQSTYSTLTEEEIAIATEKGWNLASY